ncbi:hypothetical protein BD560DRAFT_448383 [Blakeslea trispora]|nr:hypothetical protein BD560DRAFT_448383 [Blakeslea trispora]
MQNSSNHFEHNANAVKGSKDDITAWKQSTLLPQDNQKADMLKSKQKVIDNWLYGSEPMASTDPRQPGKQAVLFSPFSQQVIPDQHEYNPMHNLNAPQPNTRGPRSFSSSSVSTSTGRLVPPSPFQAGYGVDWSGPATRSHMNLNVWRPTMADNVDPFFKPFSNQTSSKAMVSSQALPASALNSALTAFPLSSKTMHYENTVALPRLPTASTSSAVFKEPETERITPLAKTEKTTWSKVVKGENLTEVPSTGEIPTLGPSNNTSTRYITDSISYMTSKLQVESNTQRKYHVIKVTNFPWEVSTSVIRQIFEQSANFFLPSDLPQCVIMDSKSGKTLGVAFVEVAVKLETRQDILYALKGLSINCTQCTRRPQFSISSYDELCTQLFPNWKGHFVDGLAVPQPSLGTVHNMIVDAKRSGYFITQKELQALLNVCRNYKINYNRRCSERPFEYLISIVMHMPWNQVKTVTTTQRDILYECYKLATASLYEHTSKKMHSFEDDVLLRFARAGILCDGFTYRQKNDILHHAHMECPKDLESYVEAPAILNNSEFTTLLRL